MTYSYGKNILPSTVGFDRLLTTIEEFDKLLNSGTKTQSYLPYNIVKYDVNDYEIQIAVAGFSSNEIDIEVEANKLTVSGSVKDRVEKECEYLYRGLSHRDFKQTFTLNDTIVVKSADIVDGILKISLENVIPESKKPKKIAIGFNEKPLLENK